MNQLNGILNRSLLTAILICFFNLIIFSQDLVYVGPINFDKKAKTFKIEDLNNKSLLLIVEGKHDLSGFLFHGNFNDKTIFTITRDEDKKHKLLGGLLNGNDLILYFSNNQFSELFYLKYNIESSEKDYDVLDCKPKKEKIVSCWSYENKFNVLSIFKNSSELIVHEFTYPKNYNKKTFDFSNHRFNTEPVFNQLYYVLKSNGFELESTSQCNYSYIEATNNTKIFLEEDKVYLNIEEIPNITQSIELDLSNNTSYVRAFSYPILNCESFEKQKTNSYLLDGVLYQFNLCRQSLALTLTKYNDHTVLNQFYESDTGQMSIANTKLYYNAQDRPLARDKLDSLNKTKKYFKKLYSYDLAVFPVKKLNNIQVYLGGYKEVQNSTPGYMGSNGMMTNGMSLPSTHKYIYFWTIIDDANYEHVTGKMHGNHVTEMNKLIESFDEDQYYISGNNLISSKLSFEFNGKHYLCLSMNLSKKFYIYEF